jgi:hypothetical protein
MKLAGTPVTPVSGARICPDVRGYQAKVPRFRSASQAAGSRGAGNVAVAHQVERCSVLRHVRTVKPSRLDQPSHQLQTSHADPQTVHGAAVLAARRPDTESLAEDDERSVGRDDTFLRLNGTRTARSGRDTPAARPAVAALP